MQGWVVTILEVKCFLTMNNNGSRFDDFCGGKEMVRGRTLFLHKKNVEITWNLPKEMRANQIDDVIISK